MNNLNKTKIIRFQKKEIYQIMELYSKKISIGEWKDYSISFRTSYAVFSIHRSFKLGPCLEIKKNYRNNSVFTITSQNNIIASSSKLKNVINHLKRPYLKLIK
jgi:hypothetical protein